MNGARLTGFCQAFQIGRRKLELFFFVYRGGPRGGDFGGDGDIFVAGRGTMAGAQR